MDDFYVHLPSNAAGNEAAESLSDFRTVFNESISLDSDYEVGVSNISFTKSWFNVTNEMAQDSKIVIIPERADRGVKYDPSTFRRVDVNLRNNLWTDLWGTRSVTNGWGYENAAFEERPYKTLYPDIMDEANYSSMIVDSIQPGYYPTVDDIVNELNSRIASEVSRIIDVPHLADKVAPRFEIDALSHQLRLFSGHWLFAGKSRVCFAHVHGPLGEMLGFPQGNDTSRPPIVTSFYFDEHLNWYAIQYPLCYDISGGIRCLLIYSDLVKPIRVGNSYERLVRIVEVPNTERYGAQIVVSYPMVQYVPVASSHFRSVQISIKDDMGIPIPFKFGRTIVTLHFRRRKSDSIMDRSCIH